MEGRSSAIKANLAETDDENKTATKGKPGNQLQENTNL